LATGLALGKAMVASNLSVFRDLLANEHSALLIDPNNTSQFAGALLRLALQPDIRLALSKRIKDMQYGDRTWQSIAVKTTCAYEQVLVKPVSSSRRDS